MAAMPAVGIVTPASEWMRVAIDCRTATARMSGVGRYVINLVEELSTVPDIDLLLLVGTSIHPRIENLPRSQLICLGATSTKQEQRLRWEQVELAKLLRSLHVDLYHATWNYGIPALTRVRTVLTVHDLFPVYTRAEFGSRRSRMAFLASQYIALTRASRIIAVSRTTRAEIARHAPWVTRRVRVVPEAADPMFTATTAAEHSSGSYLLYVGGFEPRKNIPTLLRAYEFAVSRFGISLPLYLIGSRSRFDGDTERVWASLPPAVQSRIQFHTCEDTELPRMYRTAAAFVFPSKFEGFGLPPLEALACGTPVITTRCGAIPEAVGGNACFVDADDPIAFAEAIVKLLTDHEYRTTLISRGLEYVSRMSWKQVAHETLTIYRDAAGTT